MLIKLCKLSESRIDRALEVSARADLAAVKTPHMSRAVTLFNRGKRALDYAHAAHKYLKLLHYLRGADTLNRLR